MRNTVACILALCAAVSLTAQVSEAEWEYYMNPRAYNEKTQREINRINERCREQIRRVHEYDWDGLIRRSQPQAQGRQSQQRQQKQQPRGGIQFSDEAPRRTPSHNRQNNAAKVNEARRRREHQQWLNERRECIARQKEIRREEVRRRREMERAERQRVYGEVYTREYEREGYNTARKVDAVRWRTQEGARQLDQNYRAEYMMTADTRKGFGRGVKAGRHRLGGTLSTATQKGYLDSHSIPWATMKKDAKPWAEWEKDCKDLYGIKIDAVPPLPPAKKVESEEAWEALSKKLSPEMMSQLKLTVYIANDGVFPEMKYNSKCDKYVMETDRKVFAVKADGSQVEYLELTEKDMTLDQLKDNLLDAKYEAKGEILGTKGALTGKIFKQEEDQAESVSTGVGATTVKADGKGISVTEKDGDIKTSGTISEKGLGLAVSDKINIDLNKNKKEEGKKEESDDGSIAEMSVGANLDLYKSSNKVQYKSFTLHDGHVSGYDWSLMGGQEVSFKAESKVKDNGTVGTETKASIKFAEATGGVTLMHQVPFYKGYVVHDLGANVGLGTEISWKSGKMSSKDGNISMEKKKTVGRLPITVGMKVNALRFVSQAEIENAYNKALKK